jgi:chromosome segregation ATPase
VSQMTNQVPVTELKNWIYKTLSSNLSQVERERDKLFSEISRAIATLSDFCGQLSRKAEQDMEAKRDNRAQFRAAKAVGRLTSMIPQMSNSVVIPTAKDTVSLRNLQREVSKFASEAARIRAEWLRQIRPYYIIDMMTLGGNIDKVRRLGDELHSFLVGRGTLLRSLEEVDEKLDSLTKLQHSKETAMSQRQSIEQKLTGTEQEERSLRSQVEEILQNPKIKQYLQIHSQLRMLRKELLRTGFSRLGRPLRKLLSISERGDYPIPIDVRETAKEYAKKPFTTFLKEPEGYPHLKAVMTTLSKAVSTGKLALKPREAKKVIERTERVVTADSLAQIHAKSHELKRAYDHCMTDQETANLVQRLRELRQKGRVNRSSQEDLRAELERATTNERRVEEQMSNSVKDIESSSRKLSGANLTLRIS